MAALGSNRVVLISASAAVSSNQYKNKSPLWKQLVLCQSLFQIVHTSVTMAVVAAKENTFMPGGPGTRVGQSNETFYRKRIPITCEEVKNISNI